MIFRPELTFRSGLIAITVICFLETGCGKREDPGAALDDPVAATSPGGASLGGSHLYFQPPHNAGQLFTEWSWLIPEGSRPVLISAIGDAFFESGGAVYWLCVGDGSFAKVAESEGEFQTMLLAEKWMEEWFIPELVSDLLGSGTEREASECFGFKNPPVLGGEYVLSNFEPTDLSVHFSILGKIHEQVRNLPEGTPVSEIRLE